MTRFCERIFMNKQIMNIKKLEKNTKIDIDDEIVLDEDGRVAIEVKLQNKQDLFSPYAYKDYDILENQLDEFIEDRAMMIPQDYELSIHLYAKEIEHLDQEKIERAVKARYIHEYIEEKEELRKNSSFSLIMLGLGLIPLVLLFVLEWFHVPYVFGTFFEVATWVFFWGAIESSTILRKEIKVTLTRKLRLFNAKVKLFELEKK